MKLLPQQKLNKSLDKALLRYRPFESEIKLFKAELTNLLNCIDNTETEEFHKNLVSDFLKKAIYKDNNFINTKGRQDLVIHNGKDNKTKVGVIVEAKRPTNKGDWFTADKPNSKAIQELVLYYLRERIEANNIDIKYLIATNINEWFIIDASYFEKLFFRDKHLIKEYTEWRDGKKVTKDTNLFYNEIAKPAIDKIVEEIPCIYFNIQDHEKELKKTGTANDKDLIALYKILSPYHLLKTPFANDSNELNDKFYKELLHIIGLEEAKEGGKNIIRRKKENQHIASLLEKAIDELKTEGLHKIPDLKSFGETSEEQYFNIALELCITWINRILFLKLLEGQLIYYHKGNQAYRFLNSQTIPTFNELFVLFHKVLAIDVPQRSPAIQQKYSRIPYLNSSLFEFSELEDSTFKINSIDSPDTLEFLSNTILKEQKKKNEPLKTIDYLFQFLDSYNFASEGTDDTQEDNKTLINASVLGKVFEKINGYKDGSIYTPGFITMYMSRQSIRLAVLQKFNEAYSWDCKTFEGLYEYIEYQQPEARSRANTLINDLKICDPAVGSGHFLVSALNEIIAIKSELKILQDINGKRLKEYNIDVVNDELIITDEDNDIFFYNPQSPQSHSVQQTLFTEKQTIIENCLFGVDINPNSVKICRLRLWIELLKNAYYRPDGNLETLPNIDINIKCGNSLLSRFALDADLSKALKSIKYNITAYRGFVNDYKNCKDRELKRGLQLIIDGIKADFRTEISKNDPLLIKLNKASGELYNLLAQVKLFDDEKTKKANKQKQETLETDINKWTAEIEAIKDNAIYKNAFEWRFEFPEVLNNNGDFEGFDLIIGNPPYLVLSSFEDKEFQILQRTYQTAYGRINTFALFTELTTKLIGKNSFCTLIIPDSICNIDYYTQLRKYLLDNYSISEIIELGDGVFDEAVVPAIIFSYSNSKVIQNKIGLGNRETLFNNVKKLINQDYYYKTPKFSFNLYIDDLFIKVQSLIENKHAQSLMNIATIKIGICTGNNKKFLSDSPIFPNSKKVLQGRNINRYSITYNNQYINYDKKALLRARDEEIFLKKEKLLMRQTSDKLILTIDYDQYYTIDSLFLIFSEIIELKYLLGLLNSKLLNRQYQKLNPELGRIFAQVKIDYVNELPIVIADQNKRTAIENKVSEILSIKKNNVDSNVKHLENEIDFLVYELYNLTTDEIAIVENSFTEKNKEPENDLVAIEVE